MAEKGAYVHSKYINYNNFANMNDAIVEIGCQGYASEKRLGTTVVAY
jgi:hypothetical protein